MRSVNLKSKTMPYLTQSAAQIARDVVKLQREGRNAEADRAIRHRQMVLAEIASRKVPE